MTDLAYLSATDALDRFRRHDLSPVELLDAVVARADAVEPTVNALCDRLTEEAYEAARAAEGRYMGKGGPPRPLEGVPTALKEEEPIAGRPYRMGSLAYADEIADETSPLVERVLAAGAVVHARTTTPEFSCAGFTHSRLWGVTRNPWSPEWGVGGSSGGSAAALASGTATLASGSDIGGSIRIPASFCGVVGFKPPYGRNPQQPPFNLDTYCHVGPLARTVADTALFQNVLAGPHRADIASLAPKLILPDAIPGVAGLRVALSTDLGGWPIDPDVRAATLAVGDALRAAGAAVEEVDLAVSRADVARAAAIHFHAGFGAWIGGVLEEHPDEVTDYARAFAAWAAAGAAGGTILEHDELAGRIWAPVADVLDRYDALVCPTCGMAGLIAGDGYADHGIVVDDVEVPFYLEAILTPVFNVLSRCPVLNVPSGRAENGVPTGVQIVGRPYADLTPFRVGAALEAVRPWLDAPERRPTL